MFGGVLSGIVKRLFIPIKRVFRLFIGIKSLLYRNLLTMSVALPTLRQVFELGYQRISVSGCAAEHPIDHAPLCSLAHRILTLRHSPPARVRSSANCSARMAA